MNCHRIFIWSFQLGKNSFKFLDGTIIYPFFPHIRHARPSDRKAFSPEKNRTCTLQNKFNKIREKAIGNLKRRTFSIGHLNVPKPARKRRKKTNEKKKKGEREERGRVKLGGTSRIVLGRGRDARMLDVGGDAITSRGPRVSGEKKGGSRSGLAPTCTRTYRRSTWRNSRFPASRSSAPWRRQRNEDRFFR